MRDDKLFIDKRCKIADYGADKHENEHIRSGGNNVARNVAARRVFQELRLGRAVRESAVYQLALQYACVDDFIDGSYLGFLSGVHITDFYLRSRAGRTVAYYHDRNGDVLGDLGVCADENQQKKHGNFLKGKRNVLRAYFGSAEN